MLPTISKYISAIEIPQRNVDHAYEVNKYALNHYAMQIAGRLCAIDGNINLTEKNGFLTLFPFFNANHLGNFVEAGGADNSVYNSSLRFIKFCNNDNKIKARLMARLFKLAICDEGINLSELSFFEKLSPMLKFNDSSLLEKMLEMYFEMDIELPKKLYHNKRDIKLFYRKQLMELHPDRFASARDVLSYKLADKINQLSKNRTQSINTRYKEIN